MPNVKVRAVAREGFDGRFRAGRKWYSDERANDVVEITDEQLEALKADDLLHVDVVQGKPAAAEPKPAAADDFKRK